MKGNSGFEQTRQDIDFPGDTSYPTSAQDNGSVQGCLLVQCHISLLFAYTHVEEQLPRSLDLVLLNYVEYKL